MLLLHFLSQQGREQLIVSLKWNRKVPRCSPWSWKEKLIMVGLCHKEQKLCLIPGFSLFCANRHLLNEMAKSKINHGKKKNDNDGGVKFVVQTFLCDICNLEILEDNAKRFCSKHHCNVDGHNTIFCNICSSTFFGFIGVPQICKSETTQLDALHLNAQIFNDIGRVFWNRSSVNWNPSCSIIED